MSSGASESKKIMRHSKAVKPGRSLIERIETQMDKRRTKIEELFVKHGNGTPGLEINRGRYEGLAAALAILRSSSVAHEIERSNKRLGIE